MTLESILRQRAVRAGRAQVEVAIVCPDPDAAADLVSRHRGDANVRFQIVRDHAAGLYAALTRSFPLHTGSIHSYLGAGDIYEPQAFDVVLEVLGSDVVQSQWVTGMVVTRREDGAIVRATLPPAYSPRSLRHGVYGRLAPGIQQESTWWTRPLHDRIDLQALARFRLAGDFFIWKQFANDVDPLVVECVLASFRWHGDNMSANWSDYQAEVESIAGPVTSADRLRGVRARFDWALPNRLKVRLGKGRVLRWNWPEGPWQ